MNDNTDGKVYTNSDKTLYLTISKDNLSAYLTIEDNGNMIDEKEISSLISSVGIKNGLEEALDYNIKHRILKEIGNPFLIALASARKAKAGIMHKFVPESCINIDEHYEMDALSQFEKVEKDQPLADISISGAQESGIDVLGNEVSSEPEPQVNVDDILGKNVYYSAETNQILSSEAGYPYFDHENKICVKSTFISEDIHDTNKTIYGNTTIDGVISNSNLEVFGDLWVKGNIRNCDNSGIIVHGNIIFDYAENSKIIASGKITINKNSRNSLIYANGIIEAEKNSSISGGVIQSGEGLDVFSIGSPLGILTEVEIAIAPFLKEQIRITVNKLTQARNDSEVDETLISSLVAKLQELKLEFDKEIEKSHNIDSLKIIIKEKVYPNSNIRILKDILEISEEKTNIEITVNDSGLEINEVDRL
ncbi:MAG: FapA family protein [Candidatus Cloacimonadota bacterium]|nr:FapA family protein [Candidatus Cloacimonadota bacterium]